MFEIQYATDTDVSVWSTFDKHISESELLLKINNRRCYILKRNSTPIGVMRYNLFWDSIPFLTLIYFDELARGKGYGKSAMLHWESEMRSLGFSCVMTSTQADENAQFFYRKLGYSDTGCLFLGSQPTEIFFIKNF